MKAKFIGDPTQPDEAVPETHTAYGLTFEKGKATEVPAELEAKFIGNSHFETSGKPESEEGEEAKKAN